jgi:hypothetical protein
LPPTLRFTALNTLSFIVFSPVLKLIPDPAIHFPDYYTSQIPPKPIPQIVPDLPAYSRMIDGIPNDPADQQHQRGAENDCKGKRNLLPKRRGSLADRPYEVYERFPAIIHLFDVHLA